MPWTEFLRERCCLSKALYATRKEARRALRRTAARLGEHKRCLEAYRCKYCAGWHVGRHHRPGGPTLVKRS
jgi:hypothetical protein